ncbi:hypothetical protein DPX16_14005 [Anabarilius grahami]|uniref:Uncharacterized protein n=1 Tax=Anabarilius grahami TaxID=495550 RepID=A0A3N0YA58_ANAGA|nr:hypothetical protein DPX16_14005 [Anabarilius grahami]
MRDKYLRFVALVPLKLRQGRVLSHGVRRSSWLRNLKKVWLFLISSVTGLSDLLDQDLLSPASSDPAERMLLVRSSQKEVDVFGEGEDSICTEPAQPASPSYEELLYCMTHVTARLDLAWGAQETGSRSVQTQQTVSVIFSEDSGLAI